MTTATLDTTTVRRWKRYAEYRPSGADWLPQVPGHWEVRKAQRIGRLLKGGGGNKADAVSEGVPCVRYGDLYTTHRFSIPTCKTFVTPERAIDYTPIHYGDVLFAASGETLEEIGKSAVNLMQSPACCGGDLVILRPTIPTHAPFLGYAMDCELAAAQKASMGRGTTVKHIYPDELKHLVVAFPPLPEQRAIAAFLDRETARLDALIGHKERLIALLEEKRQAVISHAVTRGLDPGAKLKNSGIPWLGMVPEHWTMTRLKFVADIQPGLTLGKDYGERLLVERPYLRVANVQDGYLNLDEITMVQLPAADVARHELRIGDVLMTEGGDFDKLGRGYVWEGQIPRCLHQNHVFAVRPNLYRLRSHYLAAIMTSAHGRNYFTYTSQQSTNLASTNATKLGNFPLPLPNPTEQLELLRAMGERSGIMTRAADRIRDGIARLQEYRTALISAAVTGQIDVRGEVPGGVGEPAT